MRKLRASAVAADPDAVVLCQQIAERMRVSAPEVLRSPFLFSPCLDGLRRPVILLPDDVGDNLRETFVHELAHLARRDGVWNLLRRLATAAFWVQPLLWVLSRRHRGHGRRGVRRLRRAVRRRSSTVRGPPARAGRPRAATDCRGGRRHGLLTLDAGTADRPDSRQLAVALDPGRHAGRRGHGHRRVCRNAARGAARRRRRAAEGRGADRVEGGRRGTHSGRHDLRGQVVDPDGKPVPGATVTAVRSLGVDDGIGDTRFPRPSDHEYIHRVTDRDGRFSISFEHATSDRADESKGIQVVAAAPGFGLGYSAKGGPIRLTRDAVPVKGRLVDLEGRPAAGVTICLTRIVIPRPAGPGAAEGKNNSYEFPWSGSTQFHGEKVFDQSVKTDSDGQFRIDGLGRGMMATFELSGPRTAFKRVWVVARAIDRRDVPWRSPEVRSLDEPGIHGADCTIAVEPTRSSRGPFTMPRPASRLPAPWSPASSLPARKPTSAVW